MGTILESFHALLEPEDIEAIERVVEADNSRFTELVTAVGLDPSTDLIGLNFDGIRIEPDEDVGGYDFSHASMRGATLRGVDLTDTKLEKTCLDEADLRDALIRDTQIQRASLIGALINKKQTLAPIPEVRVDVRHWRKLKKSSNCFIPQLVSIAVDNRISNSELVRAARAQGALLSQHLVGKIMNLQAVRHDSCEALVRTYQSFAIQQPDLPKDGLTVVGAYFGIPLLDEHLVASGLSIETLSTKSGVSKDAIRYALEGGRVTGGIAMAVRDVLTEAGFKLPELRNFATSDPKSGINGVIGRPFSMEDLMLPLPTPVPDPW